MNGLLQEAQRGAMVMGFRAGRSMSEISKFNNIPASTVKNFNIVWKEFLEAGGNPDEFNVKRKEHRRRSDAHDADFIRQVQTMVDDNPGRSMRDLARELNVSDFLIRKIMKGDLRYMRNSACRGHFLTDVPKKGRVERTRGSVNQFKDPPAPEVIHSDEINLSQDQKVDEENDVDESMSKRRKGNSEEKSPKRKK